jgi:hypothetical protein
MFLAMSSGQHADAVPVDLGEWTEAGSRLLTRGIAAGRADLVRRALAWFEPVLAATSPGDADHASAAANAANALAVEFELTRCDGALDRAISILKSVGPDTAVFGARHREN